MQNSECEDAIRSTPRPVCYVCKSRGELLYENMADGLFGVPGYWNLSRCSNTHCGHLWLNPMPIQQDIGKAYRNYYTHQDQPLASLKLSQRVYLAVEEGYLALRYGYRGESVPFREKLLGVLIYFHPGLRASFDGGVMYTPANPKGYLLDVGCGGGAFLKRLTESGWQAEGIDFDPAAVEHARSKGLHVRLGSVEEQRYPDNHFDAITMSHVIEHIHEPLRLLQECHRILKPKGYLVIATPNSRSWGHKLYKACWMPLDPPRHLQLFSPQSLLHLAEESGFTVLKMQTTIRNANNIMLVSQSIKNTGKYVWGTPRPLGLRMWTLGLQLLESVLLRLKPDIGEEIMLISCK